MKFIFPQNYNFSSKILGVIEYSAAILDLIWGGFIILTIQIFIKSISIKIFCFIIFFLSLFIFIIVGVQGESLIHFLTYMIKFLFRQKLFLYDKE